MQLKIQGKRWMFLHRVCRQCFTVFESANYCSGPLDTTIRLKYTLIAHPTLTTPVSLSTLLVSFGAIDTESVVLSLKPPKKAPHKPPKYATALIPFKQIGDAFAAVCASGRPERGLNDIEVGWAGGKEPQILGWLKRMGKLGTPKLPAENGVSLPEAQTSSNSSAFSSFPESFVSTSPLVSSILLTDSCSPNP